MWPKKVFNIFADITTHCNAGCPQCDRTNPNGLKKVDWLPLISWSLDDFKKALEDATEAILREIDDTHKNLLMTSQNVIADALKDEGLVSVVSITNPTYDKEVNRLPPL